MGTNLLGEGRIFNQSGFKRPVTHVRAEQNWLYTHHRWTKDQRRQNNYKQIMNWIVSSTDRASKEWIQGNRAHNSKKSRRKENQQDWPHLLCAGVPSPLWKRRQPRSNPEDAVVWESVLFQPLSFVACVATTKMWRKPWTHFQFLSSKPPAVSGWLLLPFLLCWRPDTCFVGYEWLFSKASALKKQLPQGSLSYSRGERQIRGISLIFHWNSWECARTVGDCLRRDRLWAADRKECLKLLHRLRLPNCSVCWDTDTQQDVCSALPALCGAGKRKRGI